MTMADLLPEHLPALRRYARVLCRTADDADDLIQDTVERALVKAHLYQPETNLRAWLFTMMRNIRYDNARKLAKRGEVSIDAGGVASLLPTLAPRAEDILHAKRFLAVLSLLEKDERQILLMVADGMTYEQIAEQTLMALGTVRSRLFRARRHAERLLDGGAFLIALCTEAPHV